MPILWQLFVMFGITTIVWAIITGIVSQEHREDYFTPQVQWMSIQFDRPFIWFSEMADGPGKLIRERWEHKERMAQFKLEERKLILEDAARLHN